MVHDGAHNVIVAKHDDEKWATVIKDKQAASEGNSLFERQNWKKIIICIVCRM
jgi:hypothetical protein